MCSTMVAVGRIRSESGWERKRSIAMRDFPEDGGPEIRRFNFPLYGEDFLSAQRGSRSKEVEEKDRGPLRCARLLLGLLAELGNQLVHHLFEFLTLPRL